MKRETAKQAIERLHGEGYEKLFLVNCYITDTERKVSTNLWNIYESIEDAKRWPKLCEDFYRGISYEFYDGTSYFDEFECVFSYALSKYSSIMVTKFKISIE